MTSLFDHRCCTYDVRHACVYELVLLTAQLTSTESDPGGSGATGRFRVETGEIESDDVSKLRHILMTVTPYSDKCTSATIYQHRTIVNVWSQCTLDPHQAMNDVRTNNNPAISWPTSWLIDSLFLSERCFILIDAWFL